MKKESTWSNAIKIIIILILGITFSYKGNENHSDRKYRYANFQVDNLDGITTPSSNENHELFSDDITENTDNARKTRKSHRSILFPPHVNSNDTIQTLPTDDYNYILFIVAVLLIVYYVKKKKSQ